MKVGEFAKRARASRMNKKAKFEEAFRLLRRELSLSELEPAAQQSTLGFSAQRNPTRPTLSLFPRG